MMPDVQKTPVLSLVGNNAERELNWKILTLIYFGIAWNFVSLFCFLTLHTIYLSGETFNSPPLLGVMSSLALFDAPVILIGGSILYITSRKINFISVMKIILLINVMVACFILCVSGIYKTDLHDFLMLTRFVQMSLVSATLILPTMFCFSITPEKYHHKLSCMTPLAMAFSGLTSYVIKKECISSELKSCFILYIISGLISFMCFLVSRNIKYYSFYDSREKPKSISEQDKSSVKLALFLCGFLFSGGFMYTVYFSAPYLSEVLVMYLPAMLSPLNLHCCLLIILLPLSSYLHAKLGLVHIMYFACIGFGILAVIFIFDSTITFFMYMLFRVVFAVSSALMLAPLYKIIYGLCAARGKLYKPMLWTIGGFSFSVILRTTVALVFTEVSPLFITVTILLLGVLAFIALVPKINRLLGNENNA